MLSKDKIFGQIEITEPVVLELIDTPQMQRLKKIHQNGVDYLFHPQKDTTRFEHSLGVYWVLKKFGAGLEEQLTGLLHDVAHGVFSHVIDYLYSNFTTEDYQEQIHHQFFKNNEISKILKKYNINPDQVSDLEKWPLADNPLPNICADRLQYTLADAVTVGKIDTLQAQKFINNLSVKDNKFIFQDKNTAKEFAELSLWMCQNIWHANYGFYSYSLMAKILKGALEKNIITEKDLMTNDDLIINKLENCQNQEIVDSVRKLKDFDITKVAGNKDDYDFIKEVSKMRVIDPLVEVNHQQKRVTELFPDFKEKFAEEKLRVGQAHYLKYLE